MTNSYYHWLGREGEETHAEYMTEADYDKAAARAADYYAAQVRMAELYGHDD